MGLIIDEDLNWKKHIQKIKDRITAISFAIYKARKLIPKKQLWMIYNSHFLAHISYLNPIWNVCSEYNINTLQRIQNKVIKTIECKPRLTSSASLYTDKLDIRKYGKLQTLITIQKIRMGKMKFDLPLNIVANHQRMLRNMLNYQPNFFRTEKCKNSLLSNGVCMYNKLDNVTKETNSIKDFKKRVISMLVSNQI